MLKAEDAFGDRFPEMYVQYLAGSYGLTLEEAARRSLAPSLLFLQDPQSNAAVLRAGRDLEVVWFVRDLKWGATPIAGEWVQEAMGEVVEERCCIAGLPRRMPARQLQAEILKLVRRFEQAGALLKLAGDSRILELHGDGSVREAAPGWSWEAAAASYTRIHGGVERGRKYRFRASDTLSVFTRWAVYYHFRNLLRAHA